MYEGSSKNQKKKKSITQYFKNMTANQIFLIQEMMNILYATEFEGIKRPESFNLGRS